MGDVDVGDSLFDENGNPCTVTYVSPIYFDRKCYRVTFKDGSTIVADEEHLWVTWDRNQRMSYTAGTKRYSGVRPVDYPENWAVWTSRDEYASACNAFVTDEESDPHRIPVDTKSIAKTLRYGTEANHVIPAAKHLKIPEADLPIHPYVLGYLLGDGDTYLLGRVATHPNDRAWLIDEFGRCGVEARPHSCDRHFGVLNTANKWRDLGLNDGKFVPDIYLRGSFEQRQALVQGLVDSDGTVDKKGRVYFFNTNRRLIDGFCHLVFSLGAIATVHDRPARTAPGSGDLCLPSWTVCVSTTVPLARLPRRAARQRTISELGFVSRYIESVEPIESEPVRCVTVDSPNSMYLAGESCIPTHNTKFGPKWHFKRCVDCHRSSESLVIAPDNKLLKSRCLLEYEDYLIQIGLREGRGRGCDFAIHRSAGDLHINFRWGPRGPNSWSQRIYFLTGESPNKIISYNISHAWLDEPASMDEVVDKNVSMRLRCPNAPYRQRLYTGTPEGLNWFYNRFKPTKVPRIEGTPFSESKDSLVLHGRSHDNPYLDEAYLQMLEDEFAWDPAYFANYVLGEWVSMTRHGFYFAFNPTDHIGDFPADPDADSLLVSFDNNVSQLTFVVIQPYENKYLIVADNDGRAHNLDDACEQFTKMFPPEIWGAHSITILGDPALHARSIHSYISGFAKIEANLKPLYRRLRVSAPRGCPSFEERSRCTNRLFRDNRLLIDRRANKVIESARTAESDTNGKIKKPRQDTWTHAMEAVDMAMAYLEPSRIKRGFQGVK